MPAGLSAIPRQARFGFEGVLGGPKGDGTQAVRKAINDDILPRHLGCFNRLLADGGTGWLAGTAEPTIADFCLVPRLQWLKVIILLAGKQLRLQYSTGIIFSTERAVCACMSCLYLQASSVPEIGGDALFAPFPHVNVSRLDVEL